MSSWLDKVRLDRVLYAPCQEGDAITYRMVCTLDQIAWDYVRPVMSIKEVLFPPSETLFTIEKDGDRVSTKENVFGERQVVWGVRSCDARGLLALDAVFLSDTPVDVFYARRREGTILVGMACKEKAETCFCDLMGGAPDAVDGLDVQVYEQPGGYRFEAVTARGLEFLQATGMNINTKLNDPVRSLERQRMELPDLHTLPVDTYWDKLAESCLSCKICSFVCPTCRCFDVRDEAVQVPGTGKAVYERIRCWDSCAGENYRLIAGGHRPRAEKGERLRNRFLCKFYYFQEQYQMESAACTGCGRCIDSCPVGIDISEVIGDFQAALS